MKKTGRLKQLLALILAGALTVGSVGTPAFGADFGDTAIEAAAEEEAVAEEAEATEENDSSAAEESGAGEESEDAAAPEDNSDSNVEAYTVTLDANGGYFVNEWDDILNESVERAEILNKVIPAGSAISNIVPIMEQENVAATFMGWSLERDGEIVSQADAEYIPVDNCTLFATWQIEETVETEGSETALTEANAEESVQNETPEAIQEENTEEMAAEGETAQKEYSQEQVVEEEPTQEEDSSEPVVEEEIAQEDYSQEQVVEEEPTQEEDSSEPVVDEEIAQEDYSQEQVVEEEITQEEDSSEQIVVEETTQEEDSLNAEVSQESEESSRTDEGSEVSDGNSQDDQTVITEEDDQQEIVSSNPVYADLGEGTPEDFEANSVPISIGEQYIGVSVNEGTLYRFVSNENDTYTFCSECENDTIGTLFGEIDGDMYALALDDNSGADNNFSTSYELEEGKTYYLGIIFADYESGSGTRAIMLNVTRENCSEHYPVEDSGVCTEPTCLEGGYCTYICRECGKKYKDDFTYPNGHSPLEDSGVVTEPTCSEKGYTTYTCNVCGEEYIDDYTDPIDHYPEEDSGVVTEPTCFEGGYTTYICSQCGEEYKDDYTDPIPHECDEDCKCIFCGMEYPYCIKNAESYTDEETGENYVTVDYRLDTIKHCEVFVEIYEEGNDYYSFSGYEYIHFKGENRINVNVKGYVYGLEELPEYYIIKAYLVDSSTAKIISNVYENYLHTKALADLLNSNPEDYEEERTIEFSENNFGVFSENTVILYGNDDLNTIRDFSESTYMIENADETAETIKEGCELAYFFDNELQVIAHVTNVYHLQAGVISVETEEAALEDVFDYLKVEEDAGGSEYIVDLSDIPEGVTYTGTGDVIEDGSEILFDYGDEEYVESEATDGAIGYYEGDEITDTPNSYDNGYDISTSPADSGLSVNKGIRSNGFTQTYNLESVKIGEANLSGDISVGFNMPFQVYITESLQYIQVEPEGSISGSVSVSGKTEGIIPLGSYYIPIMNGVFFLHTTPYFFASFEGKMSITTSARGKICYKTSSQNGFQVLDSESNVDQLKYSVEGNCRIGMELSPSLYVGRVKRILKGSFKIGPKVSASLSKVIPENIQRQGDHICQNCIEGEVSFTADLKTTVFAFKKAIRSTKSIGVTIGDFYHSFDFGDGGWGKCPHIRDQDGNDEAEYGGNSGDNDDDEWSNAYIVFDQASQKLRCLGSGSLVITDSFLIIPSGDIPKGIVDDEVEMANLRPYDEEHYSVNKGNGICFYDRQDIFQLSYLLANYGYNNDYLYFTSIQTLQEHGYSFDTVEINNMVTEVYFESDLETFTVPSNVKELSVTCGQYLQSLSIEEGVEEIDIESCFCLEQLVIPQSCKDVSIGHCNKLKKVEIQEGVDNIDIYCCDELNEVILPKHAKDVSFYNCNSLENIDIPEGVTKIDSYVDEGIVGNSYGDFGACSGLKSVSIPNTVACIGPGAFSGCPELTSVNIPDGIKKIEDHTFDGCENLTSIEIPDGVKSIGDYAFAGCYNLSSITIPDSVKIIGDYAFKGCSLTDVSLPSNISMANIGVGAFYNTPWEDSLGDFYKVYNETLIAAEYYYLKNYYIPSNVRCVGNGAFCGRNPQSVSIPSSVTYIGRKAFASSITLESIRIPSSVTYIGKEAFYDCPNLKSVIIPSSVVSIGEHAFHYYTSGYDDNDNYKEGYIPIQNLVIYGETGSYAEQYAKRNNIPFSEYNKKDITEATVTINSKTYTGNAVKPKPVVSFYGTTLQENIDYTVSYYNNINVGTAYATITGTGNYEGAISESFIINKANQSISLKASASSVEVGKTTTITTSGNKGTVTFKSSNTNVATVDKTTGKVTAKKVGAAIITATAAETSNYKTTSKTITVTVTKGTQTITAKSAASSIAVGKTTSVSTTGAQGTVTYKSSDTTIATVDISTGKVTAKKVGAVKITANSSATDNYKAASKTVTIKVVPAATASLTAANQATGIKLTWKKVTGANGYKVYRGSTLIKTITSGSKVTFADTAANTNGTKYTYKVVAKASTGDSTLSKSVAVYRVTRPALSSATNSAASKMTVKWGKNAKANGYQIQYSLSSSFASGNKAVTITSASTVSRVIGSLTKGKTYYVRIRTYKTVGSTKYWSEWSAKKSVKISK